MRRVIINMKDFVFADAVAQALCADKKSDFEVQKTTSPGEIEKYGIILSPYAVLMEVTATSPYTLEERLKTGKAVKEENRQCKIVLLVDENSEKQVADQWKEFFYCDALDKDILVVKGQKRTSGRSSNTRGNQITRDLCGSSHIHVFIDDNTGYQRRRRI